MRQANLARLQTLSFLVGPLVTFVVTPWVSYDPISLPKLVALSSVAGIMLGLLLSNWSVMLAKVDVRLKILVFSFILWSFIVFVTSNSPLDQQFWGMFGRNTGLLAYISLFIVLLSASIIQSAAFMERFTKYLIWSSIPLAIYGTFQFLGKDPIKWSSQDVFGTLGNTNFFSAFLAFPSITSFSLLLSNRSKKFIFLHLSLMIFFLEVMLWTGAIQGPIIFLLGVLLVLHYRLKTLVENTYLKFVFWIVSISGTSLASLGLLGKGPLGQLLQQNTLIFRADYQQAALKMILANPVKGVGFDSYGDWYRKFRGVISAYRTSPARTANSSHNIFLDIGTSGGIPLLIIYLALVAYAAYSAIKFLKKSSQFDAPVVAIFACWFAYQAQALISINQIGVGIWGWLFSGLLIGLNVQNENVDKGNLIKAKKPKSQRLKKESLTLDPTALIISLVCLMLFLIASLIPFNYDKSFRQAYFSGNLRKLTEIMNSPGSTAWHLSLVQQIAMRNNFKDEALKINKSMTTRFPRDIFGWQVNVDLNRNTPQLANSVANVETLDPNYPCYWPDWQNRVLKNLESLPDSKQRELLRFWTLPPVNSSSIGHSEFAKVDSEALKQKIYSFCFQS